MSIPQPSWATPSVGIRKAGPSDIPQISRVMARAFTDDPVFSWVIPDEGRRRRLLPALFALFANAVRHHDAMYIAGGAVAAALWVPAGQPAMAEDDGEAFGALVEDVCGPDASRVFEISAAMEAQHPAEPHEYLWFLGVQPAWQGNGIGSALMTPVLAQCDIDSKPVYLEATSRANVRLYERHGFDVMGVIDAHGGAPLYPMWRDPLSF
jgi:ribosomal protein S18 acetylase RimI-like enzyme